MNIATRQMSLHNEVSLYETEKCDTMVTSCDAMSYVSSIANYSIQVTCTLFDYYMKYGIINIMHVTCRFIYPSCIQLFNNLAPTRA